MCYGRFSRQFITKKAVLHGTAQISRECINDKLMSTCYGPGSIVCKTENRKRNNKSNKLSHGFVFIWFLTCF